MSPRNQRRELTCFVRADHADTAKCLDTRQLFDDGLSLRHPQNAERKGDGGDDRQAFGYGSNSQRNWSQQELTVPRFVVGEPTSNGKHFQPISLLPYSEEEDHSDHSKREYRQSLRQIIHGQLQRGLLLFDLRISSTRWMTAAAVLTSCIIEKITPNSVSLPVPTTIPDPWPAC